MSKKGRQTILPLQVTSPVQPVVGVRHERHRSIWLLAAFCCTITSFAAALPSLANAPSREYTLKAAYLYKFATYIEWPETTFPGENSPFVIGILGPDPVGDDLRKIANVKKINGRRIDVRNFENANQVGDCHILFMSRAVPAETQRAAIKRLSQRSVLLVGETPDFLDQKGVMNFTILNNRIHITVSKSAYERENLKISAQLLRVATVVK